MVEMYRIGGIGHLEYVLIKRVHEMLRMVK